MRRLMFFAGGILCGALIGGAVVLLLTPASGPALRDEARGHVGGAMSEARNAAQKRREQLEAELAELTSLPSRSGVSTKK
ncbi:MAG: YtxH domain-containing protein [Chloroflexota bacterium]